MTARNFFFAAAPETRPWILRLSRGCERLLLVSLLWVGTSSPRAAEADISKEYQIKAAFIYNFTKFVEWPRQRVRSDDGPILIGVLGSNPFGHELEKILSDRKVNGRPFFVKIIGAVEEARSVDLLFVPLGEEKRLAGALPSITHAGVLAVGESEQFARLGGTITFAMEGDRVRFEINLSTAEQGGLKLSAQLLKLAATVRR